MVRCKRVIDVGRQYQGIYSDGPNAQIYKIFSFHQGFHVNFNLRASCELTLKTQRCSPGLLEVYITKILQLGSLDKSSRLKTVSAYSWQFIVPELNQSV